jgi:hypothetical protein
MASMVGKDQGKSTFVREFLTKNPMANARAVGDAWSRAGREGTISGSLVNKLRADMGLTGNLRARRKKSKRGAKPALGSSAGPPKRRGRPPKASSQPALTGNGSYGASGRLQGRASRPHHSGKRLEELEAEVDHLLFRVMEIGGLEEVEAALRRARRHLILGSHG